MKGHVEATTLAEYREGLVRPRQRAKIGSHLAECGRCAALDQQLADMTSLLASATASALPPALASRLDAALAAEVGAVSARASDWVPAAADAASPADRRPRGRIRRARSQVALRAAATAAAVALLGGGGYALSRLGESSGPPSPPATSSGAFSQAQARPNGSSRPSAGGVGSTPGAERPMEPAYPIVASGTDYQPRSLRAQVSALVARYVPTVRQGTAAPAVRGVPAPWTSTLTGCVSRVSRGQLPEIVDTARYAGRTAAVIVVTAGGGGGRVAWVVGTRCSSNDADVIAKLSLAGRG